MPLENISSDISDCYFSRITKINLHKALIVWDRKIKTFDFGTSFEFTKFEMKLLCHSNAFANSKV